MSNRSNFEIAVRCDVRRAISDILQREPAKYEKAFARSLNEARDHIRSIASKEIRKEYHITKKDIRAEQNIFMRNAHYEGSSLVAEIIYSNFKIPLLRFDATPKRVQRVANSKKKPVSAHVQRKTAKVIITGSFVAQMASGHMGIFERKGDKSLPVVQKMGLSVAQMLDDINVKQSIANDTAEYFERRLEHNINRIIYGGNP